MLRRYLAAVGMGLLLLVSARAAAAELDDLFAALVKSPTKENYLAVHKAVTAAESYSPYSMEMDKVWDLLKDKKFKEAEEALAKARANLLLSPRAHGMAAVAAEGLGDAAKAKAEREAAAKCLSGMLATGDGSAAKAYLVSRVSDEYDLMTHLKKAGGKQALRQKDGKAFDVFQFADGTEVWFDITVVFASLEKMLKKPEKKDP